MQKQDYFELCALRLPPAEMSGVAVPAPEIRVHDELGDMPDWDELRSILIDMAISELPKRERKVIRDMFFFRTPRKKVATDLGVSEQMISKIKFSAISRLKKHPLVIFATPPHM